MILGIVAASGMTGWGGGGGVDLSQFDYVYNINMLDSYGDGWNGNGLDIFLNGTLVFPNITLQDGSSGVKQFGAMHGDLVEIRWVSGEYSDEVSFDIPSVVSFAFGELYEKSGGDLLHSFTAGMSNGPDFKVVFTTEGGVDVNTEWQYEEAWSGREFIEEPAKQNEDNELTVLGQQGILTYYDTYFYQEPGMYQGYIEVHLASEALSPNEDYSNIALDIYDTNENYITSIAYNGISDYSGGSEIIWRQVYSSDMPKSLREPATHELFMITETHASRQFTIVLGDLGEGVIGVRSEGNTTNKPVAGSIISAPTYFDGEKVVLWDSISLRQKEGGGTSFSIFCSTSKDKPYAEYFDVIVTFYTPFGEITAEGTLSKYSTDAMAVDTPYTDFNPQWAVGKTVSFSIKVL